MHKFNTIAELRMERSRLYNKKENLEEEIKLDFDELKESLKPMNMIRDLFTPDKHSQNGQSQTMSPVVLSLGSTLLDLVISKLVFNKSSYIKKFLSSYLIHSSGPSVIQKYGPTVVNAIKGLYNNFVKKDKANSIYEQSTAGGWYDDE
jgi:hypothetical protein